MKKALKITRKIFFWIFFIGLFLTTVVTVVLYVYEDTIKQYAIDELNAHLKTEFKAEDIELSFVHSFPQASIEFKNVFVADAYPEIESTDTLFFAKSMFFNFNVMDIYSGNYKVSRISLHQGGLYLKTAEDGQVNFDIFKGDTARTEEGKNFDFLLELLEVENFELRYRNLCSQQFYDVRINHGLFQGNFSQDNFDIVSKSELFVHRIKSNSFTLVKDKDASLHLDLAVNSIERSYLFKRGDLNIEQMPFHITGQIDSSSIDLNLSGDDIQLQDLVNSIVDESSEDTKAYDGAGTINFVSHIHGPLSPTEMPAIEAEFDIAKGSVTDPESKLKLTHVSFNGRYFNKQSDREERLELTNVKLRMIDSYFSGEAIVTDFAQPLLQGKMEGDMDLGQFHQFFRFKDVERLKGRMDFRCSAKVRFYDPQYNMKSFDVLQSDGIFNLHQLEFKSSLDKIYYKEISGELVLHNKDAAVNHFLVKTDQSDVLINGAMKNLMPYIDGSGSLGLIASIESNTLNLNEFISGSETSSKGPLKKFMLPENLNLNIDLDVRLLTWEGHHFTNLSSKMLMTNRTADLKNINLTMDGGQIRGNLKFKNLIDNGNFIDGQLWFTGINITNLFKSWGNFGQSSITSNHLSGSATGDLDVLLTFNPYMSLIQDQLYLASNVKIADGKLEELQALKSITDYMRSNKALRLLLNKHIDSFEEKLLHLAFKDIENTITIKDRKVYIPKMLIKSNALDVEFYGWHDFDNQIEYHFSFRFRELKTQVTENEFGIIEDDGLGFVVYLVMHGDLDDPTIEQDGKERKDNFREQIASDKEDIKGMLKSDFGFFKKDSTIKKIEKENKNEVEFIIYDDEQEAAQETIITEDKKNKKHTIKFFDKLKSENEQKNKDKYKYETESE